MTDNKFPRTVNEGHAVLILKWPIAGCDANLYVIHRHLPQLFRLFVLKCLQAVHCIEKYMCLPFYMFCLSVYWFNHAGKNVQYIMVNFKNETYSEKHNEIYSYL